MKGKIKHIFLLVSIFTNGMFCFGQKHFVTFETTNNKYEICEDKVFGIIATITPIIKNYKGFKWYSDNEGLKKVQGELANVNTSKSGEKKIFFSLIVDSILCLDTVIIIKVLPKPNVSLKLFAGEIKLDTKNCLDIKSYSWIYNDVLSPDYTNQSIRKPKVGFYKALVKGSNGCINTTESIQIKQ